MSLLQPSLLSRIFSSPGTSLPLPILIAINICHYDCLKPPSLFSRISFLAVPRLWCIRIFLPVSLLPLSPLYHICAVALVRHHLCQISFSIIHIIPNPCRRRFCHPPTSILQSLLHHFPSPPRSSPTFSLMVLHLCCVSNATVSSVPEYLPPLSLSPLPSLLPFQPPPAYPSPPFQGFNRPVYFSTTSLVTFHHHTTTLSSAAVPIISHIHWPPFHILYHHVWFSCIFNITISIHATFCHSWFSTLLL